MVGLRKSARQRGFTLIEAMISIVILSFGVLSLAVVYSQGLFYANTTQIDYIAEKKAEAAIETIFTARDTQLLTWSQINNTNGSTVGVFLPGAQPLYAPGPDGLIGTSDDDASNPDARHHRPRRRRNPGHSRRYKNEFESLDDAHDSISGRKRRTELASSYRHHQLHRGQQDPLIRLG